MRAPHSSDPQLAASIEALFARRSYGIKPGLDAEICLLRLLGNPESTYPVIHVAGTNGKGSVCAIIERILRASGYRTGLYTSPHLVSLNERFRINGVPVSDERLAALIAEVETAAETAAAELGGRAITFFEFSTALAFRHFAEEEVDIAVIETGMGGRLDATNIVDPLLSVITSVDLDHTDYLGDSLAAVAGEKCGIIKRGRPVVCGALKDEASDVVREAARKAGSRLISAEEVVSIDRKSVSWRGQKVRIASQETDYGTLALPLLGQHQLANTATALTAVEVLASLGVLSISESTTKEGLQQVRWPGRLQLLEEEPPVLLDCAHNPGGARELSRALREVAANMPTVWILGFLGDKDVPGVIAELRDRITRCWVVPINSERGMQPSSVRDLLRVQGVDSEEGELATALRSARAWASEHDGLVCIAGSIYLAGEVLELTGKLSWE